MAHTITKSAFLSTIIKEAVKQEAADIILSYGSAPALKVQDKIKKLDALGTLSDTDLRSLVEEIVPPAKEKELTEKRQVDFAYSQGESRFRVNAFYQRGHLSVVMRYIKAQIRSMEDLGLPSIMQEMIKNDNGLILLVGPTGSGKSTTLAAMVDHINEEDAQHIITIEDPIEYVYENKKSLIDQREVGVDAPSFPEALRAVLREAPNTVLLGEMRDLESISSAVTVAETGHLVLSTVHANSAAATIDRLIDTFPAESKEQIRIQLADILLAVFNQRLVPRVDESGSVAIVETMIATSAVKNAIRTANTAQLPSIIQTGSADGMHLLDDQLLKAVERGEISKENALAFANDRTEIKKHL